MCIRNLTDRALPDPWRQRKYIEPARNGIIAFDVCNLQKAVVSLAGAFTLRTRDGDISGKSACFAGWMR